MMLLHKYRVERLRVANAGVTVYDATDSHHARVRVKVIRRDSLTDEQALARFQLEARDPKVIDVGETDGFRYVVVNELVSAPSRKPPPPRPRKPPPPLPRPRVVDIPIYLDEDDGTPTLPLQLPTILPPALPTIPPEPVSQTEIGFEVPPPHAPRRAAPYAWIGLIAVGLLSGAGSFYASRHASTSRAAVTQPPPASPHEEEKTIVVEPPPPPPPVPTASTSASTMPTDSVAPVPRRPTRDPLTL
jgi:hypothetical protein